MTREEAVKELQLIAQITMWNDRREAVEMATEALSTDRPTGEWIITKEGEYDGRSVHKTVCSECGHETFYKANRAHFCPNCGAKMKGADDED